jgi:mannose-6-phosphate isomerase-like protein (cupin superfamily)
MNDPASGGGTISSSPRYCLVQMDELVPLACPCGQARRAFTEDPDRTASLHVVDVVKDSQVHYHKRTTEIYYVLEGTGTVELDGEQVSVRPGSCILIKPGCRHRAIGPLRIVNVPIPAFDPEDEWFDPSFGQNGRTEL